MSPEYYPDYDELIGFSYFTYYPNLTDLNECFNGDNKITDVKSSLKEAEKILYYQKIWIM